MNTSNNYDSASTQVDPAPGFTPEYLKGVRLKHQNDIDVGMVRAVVERISAENKMGRTQCRLTFSRSAHWESVSTFFQKQGFRVWTLDYDARGTKHTDTTTIELMFDWKMSAE